MLLKDTGLGGRTSHVFYGAALSSVEASLKLKSITGESEPIFSGLKAFYHSCFKIHLIVINFSFGISGLEF